MESFKQESCFFSLCGPVAAVSWHSILWFATAGSRFVFWPLTIPDTPPSRVHNCFHALQLIYTRLSAIVTSAFANSIFSLNLPQFSAYFLCVVSRVVCGVLDYLASEAVCIWPGGYLGSQTRARDTQTHLCAGYRYHS